MTSNVSTLEEVEDEEEIELFSTDDSDDFIRGSWEQQKDDNETESSIARLLGESFEIQNTTNTDCQDLREFQISKSACSPDTQDGEISTTSLEGIPMERLNESESSTSLGEISTLRAEIPESSKSIIGSQRMELPHNNLESSPITPQEPPTSNAEMLASSPGDKLTISQPIERLKLNDWKAGMEGLDKEKINRIIHDASKGSKYYENEKRKEERVQERIAQIKCELNKLTNADKTRATIASNKVVASLQESYDLSRTLVHIDMDAFYAAVEMRDDPKLKNVPMAVGGNDMLSTSNYLARKFGVRAAMPGFIAKKLCPELVIVPLHFDKYRSVSSQIREIFKEYDPNFSPMSLDEAYLDLTEYLSQNSWNYQDTSSSRYPSEVIVEEIREKIFQKTQLTASAGIAPNLMLAKICSDMNKPNGQYFLNPDKETVQTFIHDLPIRKVFGIGRVTEQMLQAVGVTHCKHLLELKHILYLLFSETSFRYFVSVALGKSSNRITHGERKSMSVERTFSNARGKAKLLNICRSLCEDLANDLKREHLQVRNVTLKYKLSSFVTKTRSKTIAYSISNADQLFSFAKELLLTEIRGYGEENFELRLMGVRGAHFNPMTSLKQNTVEIFFRGSNTSNDTNNSKTTSNSPSSSEDVKCTNSKTFDNVTVTEVSPQNVTIHSNRLAANSNFSENLANTEGRDDKVKCPVCGIFQVNEPAFINAHIDTCLTKQTIKDIIKEQEQNETKNSGKRKIDRDQNPTCSPVKKKKTLKSFWQSR